MTEAIADSLRYDRVYTPQDFTDIFYRIPLFEVTTTKKVEYVELPAAFDIETSSFYNGEQKAATMYAWSFGVAGLVIVGRTWEEWLTVIREISRRLGLGASRRLVCGVHNLAYDFQFFRKWLTWDKVFSTDQLKPLYAISTLGIEFRCTYRLSGYSLAAVGENLKTYKVQKAVGDLEYNIPRHSKTPLTAKEIGYIVADNKVVQAYLQECIDAEKTVTKIPLTKTGYVRRYARGECFGTSKESRADYHYYISRLKLTPDEYQLLKRAFMGGFTHASPFWVNRVAEDVESYDFTSSYPAAIVSGQFPMGRGQQVLIRTAKALEYNLNNYCCVFEIELEDVQATFLADNYISESRCIDANGKRAIRGEVVSNGRVVSAKYLRTTITEYDYRIIEKTYKWKTRRIGTFYRYKRGYLPTAFIQAVLFLYAEKTKLKGVAGKEEEYLKLKELLNSCYGMMVTDIAKEIIAYMGNIWECEKPRQEQLDNAAAHKEAYPEILAGLIDTYNKNWNRFMFYVWGVYVTAISRFNLWTAILECGDSGDYIYSDTDSIKLRHADRHKEYFDRYNQWITDRINAACDYHGIPREMANPVTITGEHKPLGVWDFDGSYQYFKTIGAKRYLVKYSEDPRNGKKCGTRSLTVSGLNKKTVMPWLEHKHITDKRIFEAFSDSLEIPARFTGKLTHTYIHTPLRCTFTDYRGESMEIYEKSFVHLEPAPYALSLEQRFVDYFRGLQELD